MLCRIKNNEQKAFIFIEQKFFFVSTIFFLSTFKICYVNIVNYKGERDLMRQTKIPYYLKYSIFTLPPQHGVQVA